MTTIREQLVRAVVVMQGDDASNAFDVMYPKGAQYEPRATIEYLVRYACNGEPQNVTYLDFSKSSGYFTTKNHVLLWNYPFNWIVLYEKVTKKAVKEHGLLVLS